MPKSAAELERDVDALTALIATLTTRLDTAEAATRDARTEAADAQREARDARADATRAITALAHVNTGAAITDPAHFQRSPYNVNAPYNLNTKSGLLLLQANGTLIVQWIHAHASLEPDM